MGMAILVEGVLDGIRLCAITAVAVTIGAESFIARLPNRTWLTIQSESTLRGRYGYKAISRKEEKA
jgi:hypothetical protein